MWPFRRKAIDEFATCKQGKTLVRESRWSREYQNEAGTESFLESRFLDGSANISLSQLQTQWCDWTIEEQLDFCQAFNHYQGREHKELLRYLNTHGDERVWQSIAISIAIHLPVEEAVKFLRDKIKDAKTGSAANLFQACWITRSSQLIPVLRQALKQRWESPDLMTPDPFCNWTAHDVIWCIDALLRLGVSNNQLRMYYERLINHPTMGSDVCKWLGERFE